MRDADGVFGPLRPAYRSRSHACPHADPSRGVSTGPRAAAALHARIRPRPASASCYPANLPRLFSSAPASGSCSRRPTCRARRPLERNGRQHSPPQKLAARVGVRPSLAGLRLRLGRPSGSAARSRQVSVRTGAGLSRREQRADDYPPGHRQRQPGAPPTQPSRPVNRASWSRRPRPRLVTRAETNGASCLCTREDGPQVESLASCCLNSAARRSRVPSLDRARCSRNRSSAVGMSRRRMGSRAEHNECHTSVNTRHGSSMMRS